MPKLKSKSRSNPPCATASQRLRLPLNLAAFAGACRLAALLLSIILLSATPPRTPVQAYAGTSHPAGISGTVFTCQLPAPTTFYAEPTDFGSAFLEWSPISGAVSYRLIVYKLGSNELVSNTVQYGTQTQIEGLQEGVTYRCTLASICSGGSTSDFIIYEDVLL